MASQPEIEATCLQVLDRFMEALNAHDARGMDAAMNFPHVRIANNTVIIYPEPGRNPLDLFERLTAEDGWHHSTWNDRHMVQYGDTKAHMVVEYTRYRADNSVIGVYTSLYVVTLQDGKWGIQARSSFGP